MLNCDERSKTVEHRCLFAFNAVARDGRKLLPMQNQVRRIQRRLLDAKADIAGTVAFFG